MITPRLAPNIPLGFGPTGARFFKVTLIYHGEPSTCLKIMAGTEGEARAALPDLCPRLAQGPKPERVHIRECNRFEAVLTRNLKSV